MNGGCCLIQKQDCFVDEEGNVAITFDGLTMVRIARNGDVMIDTHGRHQRAVAKSLSFTLAPIGIKFSTKGEDSYDDSDWNVSDGRTLVRFSDGVVLKSKGMIDCNRGTIVMNQFLALRDSTKIPGNYHR